MKLKYKILKHGDIEIKKKFLILPRCHNGEFRWLEFATLKYEYFEDYAYPEGTWFFRGFVD